MKILIFLLTISLFFLFSCGKDLDIEDTSNSVGEPIELPESDAPNL